MLSGANPLEVAVAIFTSGQSWEVECFYCILGFAALLWWAEHDLSVAPAGAFQDGIPMFVIQFLVSLMPYRLDSQAHRHSRVQSPVLWPCKALGQERGRCLRRCSLSSVDTSDKHT